MTFTCSLLFRISWNSSISCSGCSIIIWPSVAVCLSSIVMGFCLSSAGRVCLDLRALDFNALSSNRLFCRTSNLFCLFLIWLASVVMPFRNYCGVLAFIFRCFPPFLLTAAVLFGLNFGFSPVFSFICWITSNRILSSKSANFRTFQVTNHHIFFSHQIFDQLASLIEFITHYCLNVTVFSF